MIDGNEPIKEPKRKPSLELDTQLQPRKETKSEGAEPPEPRVNKIDMLKNTINNYFPKSQGEEESIEIKHFPGFKPHQRFFEQIGKSEDEVKYSPQREIIYITKKKLIEKLTHDYEQNSEIFRTVLYTCRSFFTEKELFTLLLQRFKTPLPLNLSPVERKIFLDTVISKIQIKILIFLKDWFKFYCHEFFVKPELEEMFFEMLFLMFTHPDTGKWIYLPISQLLADLERLSDNRDKGIQPVKLKIAALPEIFVPLPIILSYSHLLAKQLCIFDVDNFKRIKVTEFYNKNWTRENKHELAPNLTYIAEMSTKLSRLTSYLILMNKKNMIRVMLFQYLIDLCDQLVRLRNFNSAFAIYLGLQTQAIQRLKELFEPNLGKEYKETLASLQNLFSANNNMENLRIRQNEVMTPAVPYLGCFLGDLFFLEEQPSYLDEQKTQLNYNKFRQMSNKIYKILTFKELYGFHRVDNILTFIKGIPFISEDQIYELSYQILK